MNHLEFLRNLDVIIYHASCQDGETATHVVRQFCAVEFNKDINDVRCIGIAAGTDVECVDELRNKVVLIVDVVPCNIKKIKEISKSIICLDHHISNSEMIPKMKDWFIFDINYCATTMAYSFCHGVPATEAPYMLKCIEARDLEIKRHVANMQIVKDCFYEGQGPFTVAMCGCPRHLRSDVGNLCIEQNTDVDFCVMWIFSPEHQEYWCSLRSTDDRVDVTRFGKGHRNAAGLTLKQSPLQVFKTLG